MEYSNNRSLSKILGVIFSVGIIAIAKIFIRERFRNPTYIGYDRPTIQSPDNIDTSYYPGSADYQYQQQKFLDSLLSSKEFQTVMHGNDKENAELLKNKTNQSIDLSSTDMSISDLLQTREDSLKNSKTQPKESIKLNTEGSVIDSIR